MVIGRHNQASLESKQDTDRVELSPKVENVPDIERLSRTSDSDTDKAQALRHEPGSHDSSNHVQCGASIPAMQIPSCQLLPPELIELLKTAMADPPVTRQTLSELDLTWIMNNINLRADVNFDHDLHFMPIKGQRGDQKRDDALRYWTALAAELRMYQHRFEGCGKCQMQTSAGGATFVLRLPGMFGNLKELLEMLVPEREHAGVAERLDVSLLMQQVEKGFLDIVSFSKWVAALLKSHCAPMRDDWADEMAMKIEEGSQKGDLTVLVNGLEKLFSFLEAMKLDVANHQIRTFRFFLLADTITFQQAYFRRRISEGKLIVEPCIEWFASVQAQHQGCPGTKTELRSLDAVVHGLVRLCARPETIPNTFFYDRHRIRQLREDMEVIIHLDVCSRVFSSIVCGITGRQISFATEFYFTLQWRILAIVGDSDASNPEQNCWQSHTESVAMEIARAAHLSCGKALPVSDVVFGHTIQCLLMGFTQKYEAMSSEREIEIERTAYEMAHIFEGMSALAMAEAQRQWQHDSQRKKQSRHLPDSNDVARRLAHIATLHWQVWANLYLDEHIRPGALEKHVVSQRHQSRALPAKQEKLLTQPLNRHGSHRGECW